ncbi:unnamed protein product [Rhizoctonia solani]|uniref:DUF427 domain-containing protein n=1 Tax=Rhizoctonia solani TaxID=456999 RepID=A0A8H3BTT9_9AGAM|nr:uncharacterized protein RhiXN_08993 [Rhizoctonia solani]QRW20018.1 hypothetical protein RhiXN_08993 [Rhizoctonia solani]CAE6465525.1 unnamed protein product [Rhizoctonia solani]
MPQAKIGDTLLADSDQTIVVEGNHYFPPDSLNKAYFKESDTHTTCPWKGVASYYHVEVDGKTISDAAWYYPETKEKANNIQSYVAFYKTKVAIS